MAARTKVWFNLTRNVTANVIGQIISFSSALDQGRRIFLFFTQTDMYFFDIVKVIELSIKA